MPGVVNSYAARFGTAGTVPESALRAAASDCTNSRKRALSCRRYCFGYPSTETQNTDEHRVTAFKLCGAESRCCELQEPVQLQLRVKFSVLHIRMELLQALQNAFVTRDRSVNRSKSSSLDVRAGDGRWSVLHQRRRRGGQSTEARAAVCRPRPRLQR